MKPNVTIIILNWNGWKDTIECLESLYQINYPNYDIIVVDNHSEDDSIKKIKDYCYGKLKVESKFFEYKYENKPIKIFEYSKKEIEDLKLVGEFKKILSNQKLMFVKNDINYGFAEGNNIGIKFALKNLEPDYILLLNNDTVVDKYFLDEMIKNGERTEIGFIGPKIYYYDYNGHTNILNFAGGCLSMLKGSAKHVGINEIDKRQYDVIKKVDYVEGSCFLIKKEVLERVGLLDTRYFAYLEEVDLCMRGQNKEYFSLYVPTAKIWHKASSSTKGSMKAYYLTRNSIWFTKKYSTNTQYTVFVLYYFFFEFWRRIAIYTFYYKDKASIKSFIIGVKDGIKESSI